MKPKHQRLLFVIMSMIFLVAATLLALDAFRENIVYYYTPSEAVKTPPHTIVKMRLGGMVVENSLVRDRDKVVFQLSDGKEYVTVSYQGALPTLFREGQGLVVEGTLRAPHFLEARSILAKHDENYMPAEVVDALKKTGHWKDQYKK